MSKLVVADIPLSVYVHWPWCVQKCPYCDFNSHVSRADDQQAYAQALLADWQQQLPLVQGRAIRSIFFGGGTPSLAPPAVIASVIETIDRTAGLAADCEITLEANPGTVDSAHFAGYLAAGVNRLSLGVQSFDSQLLQKIGRIHDGEQARQAIALARRLGFDNINLDLMVGLPGQTEQTALADIETALSFQPEHLSHYQLTLEPNTPFFARPPKDLPDEDTADSLQALSQQHLLAAGFNRYEVSAWSASQDKASTHNLNYWQFGDYIGIGAGAHGKVSFADGCIQRREQAKSPQRYVQEVNAKKGALIREIEPSSLPFEFLMNALRLREGVELSCWQQRTGLSLDLLTPIWQQQQAQGLVLDWQSGRLTTSDIGYRYLN
ncbi:MAG TPA: radical SAM family heme chaperone HemW, partial [Thiotrichales bacterium]|nr:radical SAM family heme chaperone HemW [Thiotrichales bacterium]